MKRAEKVKRLLSLHHCGKMLVLPNVWSPLGARIVQTQGFEAVATSSCAIAASLGFMDGEKIRKSTALDIIERIARSVDIPVTADIEAGYAQSTADLTETVQQLLDAGVAGINIEDGVGGTLRPLEHQAERVAAIREVALRAGGGLVINARIDSYVSVLSATTEAATDEAIKRARAYVKAGADCVFPMGPGDETTVALLRREIESPINILATPDAISLSRLEALGVNRVSFGPFIFRSCMAKFAGITESLLQNGDLTFLADMLTRSQVAEYLLDREE